MTRINADNLFGLSPYIVDPIAGNGSFTTIQSAINAASLAGGGMVFIKRGTYTENLTLAINVDLQGVDNDGRAEPQVLILGNHSFTGDGLPGAFNGITAQNLRFETAAGTSFAFSCNGPNGFFVAIKNCEIVSVTGMAFTLDSPGGGGANCVLLQTNVTSQLSSIHLGDQCGLQSFGAQVSSQTGACVLLDGANSNLDSHPDTEFSASTSAIILNNATAQVQCHYTSIGSASFAYLASVAGGQIESFHNIIRSNDASGFYIQGPGLGAITYNYSDETLSGSAIGIGTGVTDLPMPWRPYATTSTVGTASFDPTVFTVTDGVVSLANNQFTSDFTAPLDMTVLNNNTTIFTVPVGKTFYPTAIIYQVVSIVGGVTNAHMTFGSAPLFTDLSSGDYVPGDPVYVDMTQVYRESGLNGFSGAGGNGYIPYAAGIAFGVNVSVAAVAATNTAKFAVQGFLK